MAGGAWTGLMAMARAAALAMGLLSYAHATPAVLQRGYDASVSGANLAETTLTPANVGPGTFGLLFKLPVDDAVFAQPLYVPGVVVPGKGTHNVVYVATMSDSVYAFDADAAGAALWHVNLATLVGATAVDIKQFTYSNNKNIVGNLGILSTPVIDPLTNTMYVVACTFVPATMTAPQTMAYRLHAIDIASGTEQGTGVVLSGTFAGLTFNPRQQVQRMSLVLSGGQVVIGFSAIEFESANSYTGWVMAYNEQSLVQSGIFATVTTGEQGGGVWQSGRPPVVDASGYVYLFTGNGYCPTTVATSCTGSNGVSDFSESVLKLDPSNGLAILDWFTPSDWATMDENDADLSSSGPLLIPGTPPVLAGGGKTGNIYLLDSTNLGTITPNDTGAIQKAFISASEFRGGPVYWQGPVWQDSKGSSPLLYNWGEGDWAKAFSFSGQKLNVYPATQQGGGKQIFPGGILALSANADNAATGILWATVTTAGDSENNPPTAGQLRALNATKLSVPDLWNSGMNAADDYGLFAKFVPPVVVNGRVYVATWSNQLAVYGLLSSFTVQPNPVTFALQATNIASAPTVVTVRNTGTIALPITSIALTGATSFSQTNTCGASVAVSASCTISIVYTPSAAGSSAATLTVTTGAGAPAQTVPVSGSAAVPSYTVAPTSLDFGSQGTTAASAPQPVTVANTGSVALPLTSVTLSGASGGLYSQTNNCGATVAVNGSCTINVVFKPTAAGATTATLNINVAGGAPAQPVSLAGKGVAPAFIVSPASLPFGIQSTTAASAPLAIMVTNTGTIALPITSVLIQGANQAVFAQSNSCTAAPVAVGAACAITVVFAPTTAGAAAATLLVNAAGGVAAQSVALTGTGVAPTYTVSPGAVAFGTQSTTAASAPVALTVTNTGSLPVPLTGISLAGANAAQFSQTNTCGGSIAVGGGCAISVVFRPSADGTATASVNINSGGGAAAQSVALSGTGATPTLTVSPDSLSFGDQSMGVASAPLSVTVTNTGAIAVAVNGITLGGADANQFSQTNSCAASLAPGSACAVQVRFSPTTLGSRSAQLTVASVPTSHAVKLTGNGTIHVGLATSATVTLVGMPVTLSWSAPGTTCSATGGSATDGWSGSLAASGSRAVTESASGQYMYGLTCSAGGQSGAAQVGVTVGTPTVTVSAAPSTVSTGEAFTVAWSSTFSSSCSASGGASGDGWSGNRPTSGSAAVVESSAGTYTFDLTCGSGGKMAQAMASVTVNAPGSGGGGGGWFDYWSVLTLLGSLGVRRARAHRPGRRGACH